MSKFAMFLLATIVASSALAKDVYVKGHTRKDGTYVQPHHRTSADSTKLNNYSTQGNTNPYTRKAGTVNPYGNSGSSWQNSYESNNNE